MRISQLQRREPFEAILKLTLERGWSEQFGSSVRVTTPGSTWRVQPLLSAYFTAGVNREARNFLRDSFRYSPVGSRMVAQWLLGTVLTSKPGLKLSANSAFDVSPQLPNSEAIVIVPGNQRVRVFDFSQGLCRVFLKQGFSSVSMESEIRIRGGGNRGPFPRITAAGEGGAWFEEALLDAYPLPRCPPGIDRSQCERVAVSLLQAWLNGSKRSVDASIYIANVLAQARHDLADICERFGESWAGLGSVLDALAELGAARTLELSQSHGDFQAGNIMVGRTDGRVTLIDWEHSAERSHTYDLLVFGLKSRASWGLAGRVKSALRKGVLGLRLDGRSMALFLLEDLAWFLHESLSGPFVVPSEGLTEYRRQLEALGDLEELLGGSN